MDDLKLIFTHFFVLFPIPKLAISVAIINRLATCALPEICRFFTAAGTFLIFVGHDDGGVPVLFETINYQLLSTTINRSTIATVAR